MAFNVIDIEISRDNGESWVSKRVDDGQVHPEFSPIDVGNLVRHKDTIYKAILKGEILQLVKVED